MKGTMKVMALVGPADKPKLVAEERPIPTPGPDDVLVKVAGCGVGFHDGALVTGNLRRSYTPGMVAGGEIGGTIVELGERVERFSKGDRVTCKVAISCGRCYYCIRGEETSCLTRGHTEGGFGEYALLPEETLVRVPKEVPLEVAGIFGGAIGTAMAAVTEIGHIRLGETVVISGAGGGVGIHALQLAKLAGARTIALTSSPSKVDALKEAGAEEVLLTPDLKFSEQVKKMTDGLGTDVFIDNVGAMVFHEGLKSLASRGRYIVVGQLYRQAIEVHLPFLFRVSLLGVHSFKKYMVEDGLKLAAQGKIKPIVGSRVPLAKLPSLFDSLTAHSVLGRAIVIP